MARISADDQPVTQITIVEPEDGKVDEVLSVMEERAQFMSGQPGCVSISLHRSLDGRRIVNYIQWDSGERLKAAHNAPEFRREWNHFGEVTEGIEPHLYEVAGIWSSQDA